MAASARQVLERTISKGECLRLILSQPRPGTSELVKATLSPVVVRRRPQLQLALHSRERVVHENLPPGAAAQRVGRLLNETFRQGTLSTPRSTYSFHVRDDGTWKMKTSDSRRSADSPAATKPAAHNRAKAYLIPENVPCPFLCEIGVMTPEGKVRAALQHKFRQVNRYLELVEDVVPTLPANRPIEIVDSGCGKSYLTFALHHLLTAVHGRDVHIVGLDRKSEVVAHCADVARRLDCRGLEFREGDLSQYTPEKPVDLAVSLHACDTATDATLAQAVGWDCRVILAVPCCQHELAPKIHADALAPLSRHGLLHDRFAALATDALRAHLLEICGYSTQVVEFIDLEHTPKNVLIRAVKRRQADPHRTERLSEYRRCKQLLGLEDFSLEKALAPRLPTELTAKIPERKTHRFISVD